MYPSVRAHIAGKADVYEKNRKAIALLYIDETSKLWLCTKSDRLMLTYSAMKKANELINGLFADQR